ncbi:glycosyltransferase [Deinococcus sp.]|uniref:glycosyltransferase n=1 Tax=Deinococcus sp. TaxID=47478 RepID=UPI003C7E9BB5
MKVSEVASAWNRPPLLAHTPGSVQSQVRLHLEVLVVGEGGDRQHQLQAVVRASGLRIRVLRASVRWQAPARNTAVRAAIGEMLACLGPGGWRPAHLDRLLAAVEGGAGATHGGVPTVRSGAALREQAYFGPETRWK